jgi:hypothetical protein
MLSKHHICIMDCLQDLFIRNTEFSEFQQGCWWAPQEATVNYKNIQPSPGPNRWCIITLNDFTIAGDLRGKVFDRILEI